MAWFQKKSDPLAERARALEAEIAALQAQIAEAESGTPAVPRLRSTTLPGNPKNAPPAAPAAPVFEVVDQHPLKATPVPVPPPTEPGPRPRAVAAVVQNFKRQFGLTPSSNPRLVKLLDSGQIRGLRPMRYERRVARNRFFLLSAVLLAVLYGLFKAIVGQR